MNLAINDPSGIVNVVQVSQSHIHVTVDEKRFTELLQPDRTEFMTQIFFALSQSMMNGWRNTYLENCFDFTITKAAKTMSEITRPESEG